MPPPLHFFIPGLIQTVVFFSSLEDIIHPVVHFLPCVPKCSLILAENVLSAGRPFIPLACGSLAGECFGLSCCPPSIFVFPEAIATCWERQSTSEILPVQAAAKGHRVPVLCIASCPKKRCWWPPCRYTTNWLSGLPSLGSRWNSGSCWTTRNPRTPSKFLNGQDLPSACVWNFPEP